MPSLDAEKKSLLKIDSIKKIDSLDALQNRLNECGDEGKERASQWFTLLEYLEGHGADDYIKIDLSIVRGLAYYTGFVYEAFEASGQGRALAGGGRYDHLIKKLSGNVDMPASGFAIGDMTLSDCLAIKRPTSHLYSRPGSIFNWRSRRKKEFPSHYCPMQKSGIFRGLLS